MDSQRFSRCLECWRKSNGSKQYWKDLAAEFGYENSEKLRSEFKHERKKRGILSKDGDVAAKATVYKEPPNTPRILLLDIETSLMSVLTFRIFDTRIDPKAVIEDCHLLCWSAKWLYDAEIMSDVLTPKEVMERNDERIVKNIWTLVDQADVIIGHNAQGFDMKKLNARFILHGLKRPSFYQIVDTLRIVRENFAFTSNRLDFINELLGIDTKTETGFDLWKKCFYADPEALETLKNYCCNDVYILEELYSKIRPWIKNHPNMGLYVESDKPLCPSCGSENIEFGGYYYTPLSRYQAFRCECGAIGRCRKSDLTKEEKARLLAQ